jgi:hypothetical protein
MNKQFPRFHNYTHPGDSRSVTVGPLRVVATVYADQTTKPTDFDCYSPENIEAWRNDEWRYVGLVLDVFVDEILVSGHAASLWGIECNMGDGNLYLSEIADELLPEALSAGRAEVVRLAVRFLEAAV